MDQAGRIGGDFPGEEPGQRPGQVDAVAFMRVSDGLRAAFAELGATKLRADEAARWHRRLIAISNVAKRDLPGALEQLERFEHDWSHRRK
ncbi:MAG TPA: hypothetical protein VNU01_01595 [Egibacteraceae bacterium]|nr:hypothetical protein [Egibacteraceae bacterium]